MGMVVFQENFIYKTEAGAGMACGRGLPVTVPHHFPHLERKELTLREWKYFC